MGKKKRAATSAEPPAPRKASLVPAIAAGILACAIGGVSTYFYAAQSAPLGVPIPRPPRPHFTIQKSASQTSSVIRRQLPIGWIGRLAPQSDGLPYLHEHYHSEKLGFDISYPYGSENIQFGMDDFLKDAVDSQVNVKIDQPLGAIKVTVPSNEGKKQLDFARDLISEALKQGAKPVDQPREVVLPGGGFTTLAYRRTDPENNFVHRLYCAVAGKRILIFDFIIRPETASDGDRYADKIMRSFQPGEMIAPAMEVPPSHADDKPGAADPTQKD